MGRAEILTEQMARSLERGATFIARIQRKRAGDRHQARKSGRVQSMGMTRDGFGKGELRNSVRRPLLNGRDGHVLRLAGIDLDGGGDGGGGEDGIAVAVEACGADVIDD
jgi:hypothetical protein